MVSECPDVAKTSDHEIFQFDLRQLLLLPDYDEPQCDKL